MTRGNRYKTIHWHFVESLEPPKVVHARCPDMVSKGNLYGQVTVRMHSRQVRPAPLHAGGDAATLWTEVLVTVWNPRNRRGVS